MPSLLKQRLVYILVFSGNDIRECSDSTSRLVASRSMGRDAGAHHDVVMQIAMLY